jgi:Holliday junction resolvasome RuvABC endonuclease subunit
MERVKNMATCTFIERRMRVLSLDPATTTGWAICEVEEQGKTVTLVDMGAFKVDTAKPEDDADDPTGRWCNALSRKVDELLSPLPDVCFVEDFFFSPRARNGSTLNVYFRAAIFMLLSSRGVRYRKFSPTHWKTFITGAASGRPGKQRVLAEGKASANKTVVFDALRDRYGVSFPETTTINGRKLKFKYDVSDAVGIAFFGVHLEHPHAVFPSP